MSPLIADFRDFLSDVIDEPGSHLMVALAGFASGCFATAGLAWVWSLFL